MEQELINYMANSHKILKDILPFIQRMGHSQKVVAIKNHLEKGRALIRDYKKEVK